MPPITAGLSPPTPTAELTPYIILDAIAGAVAARPAASARRLCHAMI